MGTLDYDAGANDFGNHVLYTDEDGTDHLGQIENISLGLGVEGQVYNGKVRHYSNNGVDAPFQLIFSGNDENGQLHVFGQQYVASFTG